MSDAEQRAREARKPVKKDNGGHVYAYPDSAYNPRQNGITRRDWAAGLAMQGILSNPSITLDSNACVHDAYILADLLIAEGNK